MLDTMEQKFCAACQSPILDTFNFCPVCGKKIKEPPVSTSIGKQIGIYLLSIFLPPLGLFPGIKYLLQSNGKAQIIGAIALVLTFLSIAISVWLTIGIMNQVNGFINSNIGTGINYQNLR